MTKLKWKWKWKMIEDLTEEEVQQKLFLLNLSWETLGTWIDLYNIGLEGKSAWGWKDNKKCIGYTGETTLHAVGKVLIALRFGLTRIEVPEYE